MVWQQDGITVYQGDCLEILPTFDAGSVNCCVTSPPYWGLRDYGTAEWCGGDSECDHIAPPGKSGGDRSDRAFTLGEIYREACGKCGAKRVDHQLGLEATPEEYVAKMVSVFREVRRVLKDDGTLWLNIGDSYNAGTTVKRKNGTGDVGNWHTADETGGIRVNVDGLKPKDLVGIPWMLAFALRADGWYLRQDIIWHKPNPMPESVTDRCTKSHEYIFLLSKSARYYYDADAIREPASYDGRKDTTMKGSSKGAPEGQTPNTLVETGGERWPSRMPNGDPARNKRSVWTVATKPYPQAHFATFPPELITPCIMAGCPEGGTVLDPFTGSGTTAEVAQKNGCKFVGCELNPDYIELIKSRFSQRSFLLDVEC